MRRAPAHAAGLPAWERSVFALVFALMATFVVVVALSAAKTSGTILAATSADSSRPVAALSEPRLQEPVGSTAVRKTGRPGIGDLASGVTTSAQLDSRLAAAVVSVTKHSPGQIAVAMLDQSTGAAAMFHASRHFDAGSIVAADILAALLLQHQRAGTPVSGHDADLAASMIENSNDAATSDLWQAIGGAHGIGIANAALKLDHTSPGKGSDWALTKTTAADQLQLLTDLTSAGALLDSARRGYELGLMADATVGQRWGVSAATSVGTACAVQDGSLQAPRSWVINSIGIVEHDGQELLITVMSKDNPTKASGISLVKAAAMAAANVITRTAL